MSGFDSSNQPANKSAPQLPVAVFRPSPDERVLVSGQCHARSLCLSAGVVPLGVGAVLVDPCGVLLAIAVAPPPVVGAIMADPQPFAQLAVTLGASRMYVEIPARDACAVGDALARVLDSQGVKVQTMSRVNAA